MKPLKNCMPSVMWINFLFLMSLNIGDAQQAATQPTAAEPTISWSLTATGPQTQGLRSLSSSGSDGMTAVTSRAGLPGLTAAQNKHSQNQYQYLYFALPENFLHDPTRPVYVSVAYFDETVDRPLTLEYDSSTGDAISDQYHPAEGQAGWQNGERRWKKTIFLLSRPRFAHRENLGADFRLVGGNLVVRTVEISWTLPADWKTLAQAVPLPHRVKIGIGGQLIVGGYDPDRPENAVAQARLFEGVAPMLKSLGVTSHEIYVRWNFCEVAPGKYDWSVYDRYVALYKRYGLKWTPFIIFGPAYSLPDWYYKKPGFQGYVCLEHHQESDDQSLWNPVLRQHVVQFLKAFSAHYRNSGVIESILLGISGDYGEAVYPVFGNGWTTDIHGAYHTHPGIWAGDPYAVADFRRWLTDKYKTVDALRMAWGSPTLTSFADVQPFVQHDASNTRAWIDMLDWYQGSMTAWASFWLHETRRNFPKDNIYLCTGGDAPPEHGSNFAAQCRAAASIGGGVRITNENSDYQTDFVETHWVASAARQYGAYFSFEPAGAVNANGVVVRIYNATASGAKGLHFYQNNLFDSDVATQNLIAQGDQFQQRKPIEEIALYYPETHVRMQGIGFLAHVQPLRDRFDFSYMADTQIADGGLKTIKALILMDGTIAEASIWQAITAWVRQGGVLIYPSGLGRLHTVEGADAPLNALLQPGADVGNGRVLIFAGTGDSADYRAFLTHALADAPQLSAETRTMVQADGVEDHVFVTLCQPHTLLWLNETPQTVTKQSAGSSLSLPPVKIVAQPF